MKKTLLALAITALSANAFAVNLDTPATPGTQTFASEIKVASTGTTLGTVATTSIDTTVKVGFGMAGDVYVRYDLTNGAKFKAAPTITGFSIASGGVDSTFVILRKDTVGAGIADVLTLKSDISVINKSDVGVSYSLYETAANAVAKTGSLNNKNGTLLSFVSALSVTAATTTPLKIDAIGSASKKFVGPVVATDLTTLTVATAAGAPLNIAGAPVVYTDIINATTSSWTLGGNFSAVASIKAGAEVFTVATDKQTATLADLTKATGVVAYTVTGTADIAETVISATLTPVALTGYEVANVVVAKASELVKNGTTKTVNLALKPGGTYSNYVRISNTDTISGLFSVKVINDAGASASFPLSDVAGQTASIAAGASTTQMTIQTIYNAAAAKGLVISGEGKLRLEVTGQVNNLDVQTYTVSKDGNSFATF